MVQPDDQALLNEVGSGSSYGICFEREVRLSCPVAGQVSGKHAFFCASMIFLSSST